ncbi:MAG: hypothetical protein JNL81_07110 [Hyphomonadaceae bacterium]|nr:hypothetical protein [Hyphomonadaceae bacterium]
MKILLPLALALSLTIAGCGQREPTHDMAPPAPADAAREDADFAMRLVLIEGHLQVGRELIEAGQTQNSLPHFGHPVRELYSDMIPIIVHRGGAQFDRDLIALEALAARENNSPTFTTAFDAALAKVQAARNLIPAEKWSDDQFVLGLVADTANVASQEYRNALVGGRIDSLIEYHDARGFIFRLGDILAAHQGADPRLAQAAALVAELRVFVEPLNPSNPPRATDVQFEEKAAALRALVEAPPAQ